MSIGPVYWGAHPGETLEKLLAVLVAQEDPGVIRRTPSSGDGGVDLLSPAGGGWHVRQVKGFVGRMSAKKRAQVKKSFELVLSDPRLDRPITTWTLAVPIDPTSDEQKWFDDLTRDAPFPCNWDGEVQWHSLAARFPYVIDYYLRDGRGRVEERSNALLSASHASSSGELSPGDVANHLEALRNLLNGEDPHYRYEFRTGEEGSDPGSLPTGAVLASSRELSDGALLTVLVFARHRYSTEDAPIRGLLRVRVRDPERGIDIEDALSDFQNFGGVLDLPAGAVDMELDAPGGLGGSFEGGGGRLTSHPQVGALVRSRLRIEHPDEGVVADLGLRTDSVTHGLLGGTEIYGSDDAGILQVRFRITPQAEDGDPGQLNLGIQTHGDIEGRPVQEVLPALRLLACLNPPNRIAWLEPYGSQVIASVDIPHATELLEPAYLEFLEHLGIVQSHVRGTVIVPSEVLVEDAQRAARAAYIIQNGSLEGTWTGLTVNLSDGASVDDLPLDRDTCSALVLDSQWALEVDGRQYDLGMMRQVLKTARLADEQPADGRSVKLVPGDDNNMTQMLGSLNQPPALPASQ